MKPKQVKKLLMSKIADVAKDSAGFTINPEKDFKRKRKLTFEKMITGIIGMGGGTLSNELLDMFNYSAEAATSSAFVQQRSKIKVEAFETVFKAFTNSCNMKSDKMCILAVDGSDIQIATNPNDKESFLPGVNGKKPYNLLHLNALYDIEQHLYTNAVIQKKHNSNEHKALVDMVDDSSINEALIIADRGYESYNNMAHIQEKGWKFLIRIKDGKIGIKSSLILPNQGTYDINISLSLTRKQTNATKELFKDKNNYKFISSTTTFDYLPSKNRKSDETLFYNLGFRVVRFKISDDNYETLLTNLDIKAYPPERLKELYAARWGIETSFRDLKYTVGLLNFHTKKVMCIQQEIYARLIMYNYAEMITSHVIIDKKQRKYMYKANFTIAVHMCRVFFVEKQHHLMWKLSLPGT